MNTYVIGFDFSTCVDDKKKREKRRRAKDFSPLVPLPPRLLFLGFYG
jgi:hypothetical protein